MALAPWGNATIGVGFGTAALGAGCHGVVLAALEHGFTKIDTAEENEHWYNSAGVGSALREHLLQAPSNDECSPTDLDGSASGVCRRICAGAGVQISTKIPPWHLTSAARIRANAAASRQELVGFCEDLRTEDGAWTPYPLDVYYIHAPTCWRGWHPRCDDPPPLLDLRSAWEAMEAVIGIDRSARRIGLSNVSPRELLDVIDFVHKRQAAGRLHPPPRIPDVLQAFADPIEPADELRRICLEHGIEFVSYSTLGTQHAMRRGRNPVLGSPIVQSIAERHDRSTAEVVLSWALQNGMSVIPRSTKREHIQELSRLLVEHQSKFLDEEDMAQIDAMKHSL